MYFVIPNATAAMQPPTPIEHSQPGITHSPQLYELYSQESTCPSNCAGGIGDKFQYPVMTPFATAGTDAYLTSDVDDHNENNTVSGFRIALHCT